jgi:hypothetical protein
MEDRPVVTAVVAPVIAAVVPPVGPPARVVGVANGGLGSRRRAIRPRSDRRPEAGAFHSLLDPLLADIAALGALLDLLLDHLTALLPAVDLLLDHVALALAPVADAVASDLLVAESRSAPFVDVGLALLPDEPLADDLAHRSLVLLSAHALLGRFHALLAEHRPLVARLLALLADLRAVLACFGALRARLGSIGLTLLAGGGSVSVARTLG